ncbi:serine hydrolase [Chromobacterium amazonense]|uniref:serine hydrolase domain-containing protein n=1 Tax=Chromobacterium amazonense TaxID=1382803 RepID=UPI00237DBDCF|nr:serine hydrolase [Chromobacterium amazonense]MDE1715953.1 serine hydrolase [Chromobacterium amazonense]
MPDMKPKRLFPFLAIVAGLLLAATLGLFYWAVPAATGYAAHYLCVQTLVSGRNPDKVFEREVKPINPLFNLVSFNVDRRSSTVAASGLGLMREATALYRPGLGCTVVAGTPLADLRQQAAGLIRQVPAAEAVSPPSPAANPKLAAVLERAVREPSATSLRNTQAVVVMQNGIVIGERYAEGIQPDTPLLGWSMTKTVSALLTGILAQDGKLSLEQDHLLPTWSSAPEDGRGAIKLRHLLQWTSGLNYQEDYLPGSDTTQMLYQSADMAAFVSGRGMQAKPGSLLNYQSGGSVVLAKVVAQAISPKPLDIVPFADQRLFAPLGIRTATIEPDASGTLVGGSYMLASARDWSRIGQLILQWGEWNGRQLVSRDWIKFMSTPQTSLQDGRHGAHLWLNAAVQGKKWYPSLPDNLLMMDGFNHQLVVIVPSRQAVITRLGATVDGSWDTESFVSDVLASLPA